MSVAESGLGRSRLRRFVAESVVIVFSILVAFAIDAAWANRTEELVTEAYFVRLREQMASNRAALQISRERVEQAIAVQGEFQSAIRPRPDPLAPDSVHLLHSLSMAFRVTSIVDGTLGAVVARGDLSDSLRPEAFDRLLRFSSSADFYEKEGDIVEAVRERYLDRYMSLAPIGYQPGATGQTEDFPVDAMRIMSDMILENRLRNLSIRLNRLAEASELLEALADSIVSDLTSGAI